MERRVRRCQDGLHFGHCVTGSSRSSSASCDRSRPRESHKLFLGTAACDRTCECWGNAGIPQDMREAPNRLIFPRLSHRINVLTRMLSPCVAWRCLRSGAGDGNRTHGSSLGSLGITIIRRPRQCSILVAFRRMANQDRMSGSPMAPAQPPEISLPLRSASWPTTSTFVQ
jgi:hypothetical protein